MTDIPAGPSSRSLQDLIRGQITVNRALGFVLVAALLVNAGLVAIIVAAFVGPIGLVVTALLLLGAVGWAAIKFRTAGKPDNTMYPPRPEQAARLEPMVARVCQPLGISVPTIFIMADDQVLNACSWSSRTQANIAYTTGLLDTLDDEELEAVTAHEAGHIVSRDSRMAQYAYAGLAWATLMSRIFDLFAYFLLAMAAYFSLYGEDRDPVDGAVNFLMRLLFGIMFFCGFVTVWVFSRIWFFVAWLLHCGVIRQREWMADAIAVQATGNPQALANALRRIASGDTSLTHRRALQAACIAGEKRPEKKTRSGRTVRRGAAAFDLLDDHPSPDRRITRLEGFDAEPGRGPRGSGVLVAAGICTLVVAVPVVIGTVGVFAKPTATETVAQQRPVGTSTDATAGAGGQQPEAGSDQQDGASQPPASQPPASQPPASQPPQITAVTLDQEGQLVFASVQYEDSDGDAVGFGFRGINGAGWAQETHTFADPSYGRSSPGRIEYPFNLGCGTSSQYESDIAFWIYDAAGRQSEQVPIHLKCLGATP